MNAVTLFELSFFSFLSWRCLMTACQYLEVSRVSSRRIAAGTGATTRAILKLGTGGYRCSQAVSAHCKTWIRCWSVG